MYRLGFKVAAAMALLAGAWSLHPSHEPGPHAWIRPVGGPHGPVRILQFYASAGTLIPGEKAKLCYGVENAKSVSISPSVAGVVPAFNRCLEIVPAHTTHYTIMAEGFDGNIATRFVTLVVQKEIESPQEGIGIAD